MSGPDNKKLKPEATHRLEFIPPDELGGASHTLRTCRLVNLSVCLLASLCAGLGASAAEVLLTDGALLSGRLRADSAGVAVLPESGEPITLEWRRVVSARWRRRYTRRAVPAGVRGPGLLLWGAGSLAGGVVHLDAPLFGRVDIPAARVSEIFLRPAGATRGPRNEHLPSEPVVREGVMFSNGDIVEGHVRSADGKKVWLDTALFGKVTLETSEIVKILLGRGGFSTIEKGDEWTAGQGGRDGRAVRVHFVDGELLDGELERVDDDELVLKTAFGRRLVAPASVLLAVQRLHTGMGPSALAGAEVEVVPFFDGGTAGLPAGKPYYRDCLPDGSALSAGGTDYVSGLCVPSRSRTRLPLEGERRCFGAVFALHDTWGRQGNVDLQVLLDGSVAWEKKGLVHGQSERLHLPLGDGQRLLEIVVDYGEFADFGDWLVIGEPFVD